MAPNLQLLPKKLKQKQRNTLFPPLSFLSPSFKFIRPKTLKLILSPHFFRPYSQSFKILLFLALILKYSLFFLFEVVMLYKGTRNVELLNTESSTHWGRTQVGSWEPVATTFLPAHHCIPCFRCVSAWRHLIYCVLLIHELQPHGWQQYSSCLSEASPTHVLSPWGTWQSSCASSISSLCSEAILNCTITDKKHKMWKVWHCIVKEHLFTGWEVKEEGRVSPCSTSAGNMCVRPLRYFTTLLVSPKVCQSAVNIHLEITNKF